MIAWIRKAHRRAMFAALCRSIILVAVGTLGAGCGDSGGTDNTNNNTLVVLLDPDPVGMVPGATRTVTVSLTEPTMEALTLPLSVEDAAVAIAPDSVTIEAGSKTATFAVEGLAVGQTALQVGPLGTTVHVVSADFDCTGQASGTLSEGATVEATTDSDLAGAAITAPGDLVAWTLTPRDVSISCAEDITPAGYLPVGPAVTFDITGGQLEKYVELTLPWKAALLPDGAHEGHLRVAVKLRTYPTWTPPVPNVWPVVHPVDGRLTFRFDEGATYQVVIRQNAGQPVSRRFTYRAIFGFSMGGGGSGAVGLRHPERFDFVVQNGAEPAVGMAYTLGAITDYMLGGFCTAEDELAGTGNIGELCPVTRVPLDHQYEKPSTFERWIHEPYMGTHIHLRREFYVHAIRDIVRAYGNPFYYNPDSAVVPTGVSEAYLSEPAPCDNPVVLDQFYHRQFNPDGTFPVITFCDASEQEDSPDLGLAVFDPALPKTNPVYALLAVDVNGNGRRDSGEPVLTMAREPFEDVGDDGLTSADEPGFDPVTNPDPAGDDYHWMKNPLGAEGNWTYDAGEPFEDTGLDGVAGAGCEVESGDASCYDHGEGNGVFDRAPGWEAWLQRGARQLYAELSSEQRERITVWSDSGMRDFFNCHVSTNQFVGLQAALGENVRTYFGFQRLVNDPVSEDTFDFQEVNFRRQSRHMYVQYGNPDASEAMIAQGDGKHVGTGLEIIYRLNTGIAFLSSRWPKGNYTLEHDDRPATDHFLGSEAAPLTFEASNGRTTHYAVYLPPGYYLESNQDLRYPVVYFLHGYGQGPDDLIALSGVFENYMISPNVAEHARYQKMILIYVDGYCRPGGQLGETEDGYFIWNDIGGDGCERGTFYTDSPSNSEAKIETALLELMDIIDIEFRTKAEEVVEVMDLQ